MNDKFKKRRDHIKLVNEIENIYVKAKEMQKTATIIYQHCLAFIHIGQIYNIISNMKLLLDISDDICYDLSKIINSENPTPIPEFIIKMKPLLEEFDGEFED